MWSQHLKMLCLINQFLKIYKIHIHDVSNRMKHLKDEKAESSLVLSSPGTTNNFWCSFPRISSDIQHVQVYLSWDNCFTTSFPKLLSFELLKMLTHTVTCF